MVNMPVLKPEQVVPASSVGVIICQVLPLFVLLSHCISVAAFPTTVELIVVEEGDAHCTLFASV